MSSVKARWGEFRRLLGVACEHDKPLRGTGVGKEFAVVIGRNENPYQPGTYWDETLEMRRIKLKPGDVDPNDVSNELQKITIFRGRFKISKEYSIESQLEKDLAKSLADRNYARTNASPFKHIASWVADDEYRAAYASLINRSNRSITEVISEDPEELVYYAYHEMPVALRRKYSAIAVEL